MADGKNGEPPSWITFIYLLTYCFKSCRRWVSPGRSGGPSALGWALVGTILCFSRVPSSGQALPGSFSLGDAFSFFVSIRDVF